MNSEIVVAIIALSSVLISALISYIISFKGIKHERKKALYEIESTFYNQITESRIDSFKVIYEIISDFAKDEKTNGLLKSRKKIDRDSIIDFITKYDMQDSKFSLLFSSKTGSLSSRLRNTCYEILRNTDNETFRKKFNTTYRTRLIKEIGNLESALKADIGIFILEYKDFDRKIGIRSYADIKTKILEKK